jgi:hypothetical protein
VVGVFGKSARFEKRLCAAKIRAASFLLGAKIKSRMFLCIFVDKSIGIKAMGFIAVYVQRS